MQAIQAQGLQAGGAGKRGRGEEIEAAQKRVRLVDYTSTENRAPPTQQYRVIAEAQIDLDFPMFYKKDVQNIFFMHRCLYAPAFMTLYQASLGKRHIDGLRRTTKKRTIYIYHDVRAEPEFFEEFKWVHQVWKVDYDATFRENREAEMVRVRDHPPINRLPSGQVRVARVPAPAVRVALPARHVENVQAPAAHVPQVPVAQAVQPVQLHANVQIPIIQVPVALPVPQVPVVPLAGVARVIADALVPRVPEIHAPVAQVPVATVPLLAFQEQAKMECACCYNDDCSFENMIQCPDAHLFCMDCVRAQAGVAVGARQRDILCMDTSGCKQPFPASELRRCLDARTYDLWQRIVQADDIAAANLEGLEHCPSCDFAIIMEVGMDVAPVLSCQRPSCGLVSCRRCKKAAHTGRPCHDIEEANLKREHVIEEAMTKSMVRECPGCNLPFIKAEGCNKIVCQNARCRLISCYICRQVITLNNPYDHFNRPHVTGLRCVLWDGPQGTGTERRHELEVEAARQRERQRLAMVMA